MVDELVSPLYKREQWPRWVELFIDSESPMTPTFDVWLADHSEDVAKERRAGRVVHVVEVDVNSYLAWVRSSGLSVKPGTRADYPIQLLIQRMREKGDFEG
jgi:hypothetical protein